MQFPVVLTFFESDISNVQFARLMQHSEHVCLLQRSANTFSASEGYRNHYRVLVTLMRIMSVPVALPVPYRET